MPKFLKKLSLIFLSSILFLNSMVMPFAVAHAADEAPSNWYNQGFTDWYAKVYGDESPPSEIFGERYTAAQVQWILYSLFSFPINFLGDKVQKSVACMWAFTGGSVIDKAECIQLSLEAAGGAIDVIFISTGVTGNDTRQGSFASSIIDEYQNRPLSGIKYINNLVSGFGVVSSVQAQGFGYGAVDGLQQYWQGFRNVAYALVVFVVIVFAFMIMFRVKLSPQLVISVQSALPKIVVALVLATFSYAIAGFVIDLSYVVGGLLAQLMHLAGFSTSFDEAFRTIMPIEATTALGGFYILIYMFSYTILFFLAAAWSIIGAIGGLSIFAGIGSVLAILMTIWVLILMLWYTVKIPWVLLKNLISLFLSIVVAPIQIVIGALVPAIGFSMWFRKIIAEALVFPLTGLFLFLAVKTLNASFAASWGQLWEFTGAMSNTNLWAPPILGSSADMAGVLWIAVSFVFITMVPKAVDIMKMLVMGAKFDFGSAIGEAMAPIDMVRKSAPGRAVSDIATAEGAVKAMNSRAAEWVARKVGYRGEWDDAVNKFKAMLQKTR
ncbi:MAG: hypothetical protein QY322_03155 [bacterium]|nr:MAG: hypothetical protein QY322_03155 [bacterium]